ncbi:hypothetical protein TYRP_015650 [Tyrophagus putrescentiae]|nr:hypothetical protein TYRP_015650 [Tyrophagus putrescentiae]
MAKSLEESCSSELKKSPHPSVMMMMMMKDFTDGPSLLLLLRVKLFDFEENDGYYVHAMFNSNSSKTNKQQQIEKCSLHTIQSLLIASPDDCSEECCPQQQQQLKGQEHKSGGKSCDDSRNNRRRS